jgi:hypothetical protein
MKQRLPDILRLPFHQRMSMIETQRTIGPVRPHLARSLHFAHRLQARSPVACGPSGGGWTEVSIPDGRDRLHEAGSFHNLELAAGRTSCGYVNDLRFPR